ncbi:MAG TPA: YdeI/OmpD-associated family protein [Roseiarcus sp.]|jgi:uncharacterized protein YdeI (YjbR/CyaY-like superfamily)
MIGRAKAKPKRLLAADAAETESAMEGNPGKEEMRAGLPILAFADARAFDAWLEAQGSSAPGLWLRLAKKGAPERTLTKLEAIDAALCHGWIDGQLDTYDDHSWLIRFTPRKPRSKWSELNRARATELLAEGRMRPAGVAQVEMAKSDGRWDVAYAPASTAEAPPDLAAALAASPKAAAFFATLTGANRYAILYRIGAVRTPEARARKIARFIAMLERGETIHG